VRASCLLALPLFKWKRVAQAAHVKVE
jgi:hypothetical protein